MPFGLELAGTNPQVAKASDTAIVSVGPWNQDDGNTLLSAKNDRRSYLELDNPSSSTIRYGYENRDTLNKNGYPLRPNESVTIPGDRDVFVVLDESAPGDAVDVAIEFGRN